MYLLLLHCTKCVDTDSVKLVQWIEVGDICCSQAASPWFTLLYPPSSFQLFSCRILLSFTFFSGLLLPERVLQCMKTPHKAGMALAISRIGILAEHYQTGPKEAPFITP